MLPTTRKRALTVHLHGGLFSDAHRSAERACALYLSSAAVPDVLASLTFLALR